MQLVVVVQTQQQQHWRSFPQKGSFTKQGYWLLLFASAITSQGCKFLGEYYLIKLGNIHAHAYMKI